MATENSSAAGIAAVNGGTGGAEKPDREHASGSAEPATFGFPAPISPIDASFAAGDSGSDRPKRKYTRRTSFDTGPRAETQKTAPDLGDLKSLIFSLHQAISAIVPEMELDKEEASRFADATQNLMKHYDHKVNPKVMAWMQFSCVVGGIYGPRAVTVWKRMESAPVRTPDPQPINAPRAQAQPQRPVKPLSETAPSEIWPSAPIEDRR